MTPRRAARLAALLVAALGVAACTAGGQADPAPEDTGPVDATVSVAVDASPASYDGGAGDAADAAALNQVLRTFTVVGGDGTRVPDTEFGTYEKVSDDPLVVDYTIDPDAVWSDGEPIDCDDVLLDWAARSGAFEVDGVPVFDDVSGGYPLVARPDCGDDDRSFRYEYTDTFADWQALPGRLLPAHVAERESGVEDVVAAVVEGDLPALQRLADFMAEGWDRPAAGIDPALVPSSGPYVVALWEAERVVLEANPRWWGAPPGVSRLELVVIPRGERAAALVEGAVQVAELPPDAELLAGVAADGRLSVERGSSFGLAQLRFASLGSLQGPLRAAFAACVPRGDLVAQQVVPLLVDAEPAQSRFYFPFQPQYEDVSYAVSDGRYDEVRADDARQVLTDAGALGTRVRMAHDRSDPREVAAVELVVESCATAGFDVEPVGDVGLAGGDADVALVLDEGGPLVTDVLAGYRSDGRANTGGYADPEVDALAARLLVTPDPVEQVEIVKELDALLWRDLPTLPLFAVPVVVAHDATVAGVALQPSDAGITWNASSWTIPSATPTTP